MQSYILPTDLDATTSYSQPQLSINHLVNNLFFIGDDWLAVHFSSMWLLRLSLSILYTHEYTDCRLTVQSDKNKIYFMYQPNKDISAK